MYAKQDQGTLTKNSVRQMAKQFEQISVDTTSYVSSHEANFKQCNWWLDMPSSAACFDDLMHDSHSQCVDIAGNSVTLAVDNAEIANEFQRTVFMDKIDNNDCSEKADFLVKIDKCLSFPTQSSTKENAMNR